MVTVLALGWRHALRHTTHSLALASSWAVDCPGCFCCSCCRMASCKSLNSLAVLPLPQGPPAAFPAAGGAPRPDTSSCSSSTPSAASSRASASSQGGLPLKCSSAGPRLQQIPRRRYGCHRALILGRCPVQRLFISVISGAHICACRQKRLACSCCCGGNAVVCGPVQRLSAVLIHGSHISASCHQRLHCRY